MRVDSYILASKEIIAGYDGKIPFAAYIKTYFSANKKFGSRDRKAVAHLCYCFFRLGCSFRHLEIEERIKIGLFLTAREGNGWLAEINNEWSQKSHYTIEEKLKLLRAEDEAEHVFPIPQNISGEIEVRNFVAAHFVQPYLFLRMRSGKEEKVMNALADANLSFIRVMASAVALENATKVDDLFEMDKDAVVQDLSSQQVFSELHHFITGNKRITVWDCCAASGGKSILLWDTLKKIDLTVSDIRDSILKNLRNRFRRAGIRNYQSFVADIAAPQFTPAKKYDLVICDAPCSGSGTWSRTPEQLSFFTEEKLTYYSNLQKWIVLNAAKAVLDGGMLVYITCSVYRQENEEVVLYLQQQTGLQLRSMQYYKGYESRADTLFVALFTL